MILIIVLFTNCFSSVHSNGCGRLLATTLRSTTGSLSWSGSAGGRTTTSSTPPPRSRPSSPPPSDLHSSTRYTVHTQQQQNPRARNQRRIQILALGGRGGTQILEVFLPCLRASRGRPPPPEYANARNLSSLHTNFSIY